MASPQITGAIGRFDHLPPHPRLFSAGELWAAVGNRAKNDPVSHRLCEAVFARADLALTRPVTTYEKLGRRILMRVRLAMGRILALAMACRLSGDERYFERALAELRAAADLPDWNPSHFLDTAEMTLAMAVGYDWLHEWLGDADRTRIASAILDKGLLASIQSPPEYLGWIRGTNNWAQVCHAGVCAGALATAANHPELAENIVLRAFGNLAPSAKSYAPDGAYEEGPMYWDYGTSFHVMLADMLQTSLGSSFETESYPGFLESADYITHVTLPTGEFFNYADCNASRDFHPAMFWFARQRGQPELAIREMRGLAKVLEKLRAADEGDVHRLLPLALLWWEPAHGPETAPELPRSWIGRGGNSVSVHRSAWDDSDATCIAIKGGCPGTSHAHMDSGSFVHEAGGVRWAVDLGRQDYHSLESQGIKIWDSRQDGERWKVFRLGPNAHNILRFNGGPQNVLGEGEVTEFQAEGNRVHATVDLAAVYPAHVSSVTRKATLDADQSVTIEDNWTAGPREVLATWQWLTFADVRPLPDGALLSQSGKMLHLQVQAPVEGWDLKVEDASALLNSYDEPNPGLRRLVLQTSTPAHGRGRFVVVVRLRDKRQYETRK